MTLGTDQIALAAPFHPKLSDAARRLNGQFRGKATGWVFARNREMDVRALCFEFWGVDGTPEAAADTATLRIETTDEDTLSGPWTGSREIWLCGRQIAVSMADRHLIRPGRGVKFLHGRPLSLSAYRLVCLDLYLAPGTVFTLKDVPRMALPRYAAALDGISTWATV